jgi:2-oxoglutarate ferredoxin oxidoreductase subunit delta
MRTPFLPRPAPVRGRVVVVRERCKGCELCIAFCPTGVLARSEGFNAKGYHYPVVRGEECIHCRLCTTVCPEYAIFALAAPAPEGAGVRGGGGS